MEGYALNSSSLILDPLLKDSCLSGLKTLTQIIETCIGPHGKLKLLRHIEGGSVTVTSSSQRLFHLISVKNVILKIVLSAAKSQLKNFNDGALYYVLLVLKSTQCALSSEYPLPVIGILYERYSQLYLECLNSDVNLSVMKIDFSNLHHLRSIVRSSLNSKPGCVLTLKDKNYLSTLILESYLMIIPPTSKPVDGSNIRVLNSEGMSVTHSKLVRGVLIPVSKRDGSCFCNRRCISGALQIALFTVSLAGDADFPVGNLKMNSSMTLSEVVLKHLEAVIEKLIFDDTHLVFCQKVIHPKLKMRLQNAGILVLDRLGSENARFVRLISGGFANSSLFSQVSYGVVSRVSIEQVGGRSFVLLSSEEVPFFSLLLCHFNAEAAAELQVVCRQTVDAMFRVLRSGRVCFGAGCTEVYTAHLWASKTKELSDVIQKETGCGLGPLHEARMAFLRIVTDACVTIHQGNQLEFVTENVHGHLWKVRDGRFPSEGLRCACGRHSAWTVHSWTFLSDIGNSDLRLEERPRTEVPECLILDEFSCKASAFSLAFETSPLLLRTSALVCERETFL